MTENGNEELKWSEKMFHGQGNVGWSLTFDMTNKYPL